MLWITGNSAFYVSGQHHCILAIAQEAWSPEKSGPLIKAAVVFLIHLALKLGGWCKENGVAHK